MRLRKVLIFGCGVIGGNVLDLMTNMPERFELIIAARDEERLRDRANLAMAVAMNLHCDPHVDYRRVDLNDTGRTAEMLVELRPEIIINATSLQTFWLISTLPRQYYQALDEARIGPWLPCHLSTARKVMEAVSMARVDARVVNVSFPDCTNPVLAKVGLAPFIGAGNIGNTIPTIKRAISYLLRCSLDSVDVRFIAHHFVGNRIASFGETAGAPYHLTVYIDGINMTARIRPDEVFRLFTTRFKRLRGVPGQIMAASSVAAIVRAIAKDSGELLHAPGPNGLVGGYPTRVGAHRVEVVLPNELSLAEATRINRDGQVYEGIEQIDEDGTVYFCEREMAVMKRVLGYECRSMKLDDVDGWAAELSGKYRAFTDRINLPA